MKKFDFLKIIWRIIFEWNYDAMYNDLPGYGSLQSVNISYNNTPNAQTSLFVVNFCVLIASGASHLVGNCKPPCSVSFFSFIDKPKSDIFS